MATSVTGDGWTLTGASESRDEMLAALSTDKPDSQEPKVTRKDGKPVTEPDEEAERVSKAASELGKKGGEAAAKARKALKPIPDKVEPVEDVDEAEQAKAKVDEEIQAAPNDAKKELASERIAEATRAAAEAKREAAAARADAQRLAREVERLRQPAPEPKEPAKEAAVKAKPKLEEFETYEDYTSALVRHEAEQILASRDKETNEREQVRHTEAQVQGWIDTHVGRMTKAVTDDPALKAILTPEKYAGLPGHSSYWVERSGKKPGPFNVIVDEIISSESGPRILAHLDQNPDVLQQLMVLPNRRAIEREIMRLDARLESATPGTSPPKREASKANPPPRPVEGSPHTADVAPGDDASYDEHVRYHNAKARRKR